MGKNAHKNLVDARESFRNKTGIGVVARNLCQELSKRTGYQVIPSDYQLRTPPKTLKRNYYQVFLNLIRNLFWKQIYLPVKMLASGAQLLFCPDPISPLLAPGKVILLVHDLMFFRQPKMANRYWGLYWRVMIPLSLRRAHHILTVSGATRNDLKTILDINLSHVTVAYNGYDRKLFHPVKNRELLTIFLHKYKLPSKFILFIGSIEARRNIKTLLQAIAYLRDDRNITIPLIIGGAPTEHSLYLENIVSTLKLNDQVTWLGYVSDEDLPLLYNLAVAYIYPSLMEGFGLTVLEAMACGCPVICSNVDSLPEVAGDAGVLLPPDDVVGFGEAIHRVWTEPGLAEAMRERGLQQAQKFSWERMAEIVAKVCNEI